ncbi:MAG: hypothetical protein HZB70_03365 [Candidatus Berkelbacteria bacterium]|nr:MAG: hypothetical protein HZB70_03365 [Candidatus Berkelbacteria bacterium]QQG51659.1 MAG: hypothetical protein HY845_03825 [Candidatus Berkelbacteria bacterium]
MAATELSAIEKFRQEQSFFLVNRRQLFKGWPHVKQAVVTAYYLFGNGDRRDAPTNDWGLLLRNMVPAQREREYWLKQREKIAEALGPSATERQVLEKLDKQIYATLLSYYQAGPTEVRTRMGWVEEDKRDGVRNSNALLARKLSEVKKMRKAGIRSDRQIQIAGSRGLEQIPGIAKKTATKIVTAVGDKKLRARKPQQLVLFT